MKNIKYILSVALVALMFSCAKDPEFYTLKEDVAAMVQSHGNVVVYPNSLSENVVFTWTGARFIDAGTPTYTIYGVDANNNQFVIGTTTDLRYSLTKGEFNNLLLTNGYPANTLSAFQIIIKATSSKGSEVSSAPVAFNVQPLNASAFVAPVLDGISDFVMTNATSATQVQYTWSAASLEAGAGVKYALYLLSGSDTISANEDMSANDYSITYEALNDLLVAAGVTEGSAAVVTANVVATSDYGSTISSNTISTNVTTYVIPYPAQLYNPGSHQGWNPAASVVLPQTSTRGTYKGFIDMFVSGSDTNASFKFTSDPDWNHTNYGGTLSSGTTYTVSATGDNFSIAEGVYYWTVDLKHLTATAVKMETVGLVGSFAASNWGSDVIMTRDDATNTWKAEHVVFNAGEEFKIRFQTVAGGTDWSYNLGGAATNLTEGGNNIAIATAGTYTIVLDIAHSPYTVTYTAE